MKVFISESVADETWCSLDRRDLTEVFEEMKHRFVGFVFSLPLSDGCSTHQFTMIGLRSSQDKLLCTKQ